MQDHFKQPVERALDEGVHVVVVVADGAAGHLHRQQGQHAQPGGQPMAEEEQAKLDTEYR